MGDGAKKSGGGGFFPGLVLGVIVGAATAFVALEVLDSPRINVEQDLSAASGSDRGERDEETASRDELIERAKQAAEEAEGAATEAAEGAGDALEEASDEAQKLIDPPADPSDG